MINIFIQEHVSEHALIEITKFVRCMFRFRLQLIGQEFKIEIGHKTWIYAPDFEDDVVINALLFNINQIIRGEWRGCSDKKT